MNAVNEEEEDSDEDWFPRPAPAFPKTPIPICVPRVPAPAAPQHFRIVSSAPSRTSPVTSASSSVTSASSSSAFSSSAASASSSVSSATPRVGLIYDQRMTCHQEKEHPGDLPHPESPKRISVLWEHLRRTGLMSLCVNFEGQGRTATDEEILLVHTLDHTKFVKWIKFCGHSSDFGVTGLHLFSTNAAC